MAKSIFPLHVYVLDFSYLAFCKDFNTIWIKTVETFAFYIKNKSANSSSLFINSIYHVRKKNHLSLLHFLKYHGSMLYFVKCFCASVYKIMIISFFNISMSFIGALQELVCVWQVMINKSLVDFILTSSELDSVYCLLKKQVQS